MNQSFALMVRFIFAFVDLLIMNIVFLVIKAYVLNIAITPNNEQYTYLWIIINVEWIACCGLQRLYEGQVTDKFEKFIRRTLHTYFLFLIMTLVYLYFSRQLVISRVFVITFLCSFPLCLLLNRAFYLLGLRHLRQKGYLIKRVMIIGYNEIGKKLAAYFERSNTQMHVVGFCEEDTKVNELSHYPILNTLPNAVQTSKELQITEIYSTILPEQDKRVYELMHLADQACIRFKLVPDLALFVNQPMHVNYLSGLPVLSSRDEPLDDLANRLKKRSFDIIFSILVIVFLLSWLLPLLALAIWIDSRGPIFFVQKRSGLNNKPFNCIKFRSMHVNHDANNKQATRNDERFTRVGRFIRKTNLDEFPQFLNVIKGEMSIVGPRPHMLKHTEDYSAIIRKYMVRQFIKPGITGWAQINGHRGETHKLEDMEVRVDHDLWYMENWNFLLDSKIIFLTAYNVIKGEKNAY